MDRDYSQMRITREDHELIKKLYGGEAGMHALKMLRKIFLPTYDPEAPVGQNMDLFWMGLDNLPMMSPADREISILSRIKMIHHVEQQLLQLNALANQSDTSADDEARNEANSTR